MSKRMLTEPEGYVLLDKYDIPVPGHRIVKTAEDAVIAAEKIGYPVVIKVISPQVIHKSDAGGVVTGLKDEKSLKAAFMDMIRTVTERVPDAEIKGIIVEKELAEGLELIIGGKIDPAFGKIITFGSGGTLVELIHDVEIRVLPVGENEIRRMIKSIHGYPLIRGFRGGKPLDEETLVKILKRACDLFMENPAVSEFDINPLILYEDGACAVDSRFIIGENEDTMPEFRDEKRPVSTDIFNIKSIALVGASSDPEKIGYTVLRNLLSFSGTVYPVNPHAEKILGKKAYKSLHEIPDPVDAAVLALPAEYVPEIIRDAGDCGIPLAVIISAGFRETGEHGAELEKEVLEMANLNGVRIIGPNCLGVMFPKTGLNATFDPVSPHPGNLAFISQSGAIITTVVDWSLVEDIGMSAVISIGNQADLDFEDYIQLAENDPDTKAIILYIEEIKNGERFLKYTKKVAEKKPIIAIKSGKSERGQEAASSHTGSMAGSYEVYNAAFRQAGIITVHSLTEAFNVAGLLASEGYPHGKRAVVITNAGGFAVLSADYAEENDIELIELSSEVMDELNSFLPEQWSHENPIDLVGDGRVERFAHTFDVLINHQDEWDIAFVISIPTATINQLHLGKEIVRLSDHTQKMIVCSLLGGESVKPGVRVLRDANIINFSELEKAFKAIGLALKRNNHLSGDDALK